MRSLVHIFLSIFLLCSVAPGQATAQKKGDVVFTTSFDSKRDIKQWYGTRKKKQVQEDGKTAMRIISKKDSRARFDLPIEKVRGCKLTIKVTLKTKDIVPPAAGWQGIKAMLHVALPWEDIWPQANASYTQQGWQEVGFSGYVPADATAAQLVLGIEETTGTIWFDKVTVEVTEAARARQVATNRQNVVLPATTRRGTMVATNITEADLKELASWGANHIRWQLTWGGFPYSDADTASPAVYKAWLEGVLARVDALLPLCHQLGMVVVLDLHTLPGGRSRSEYVHNVFKEKVWQDVFIDCWRQMAARYKNETAVWGYDLGNEPVEGAVPAGLMGWKELATKAAMAIRQIDTNHAIIIEGAPNGSPEGLAHLEPLPIKGAVYSFHMYVPELFTLQGLGEDKATYQYPGIIKGKEWNKETLRKVLGQVVNWQKDYGASIYVGEFSAIRWAPGESAYLYLKDCIELFEEFGWDWAYHAFREYHGWSVEHSGNKADEQMTTNTTARKALLLDAFKKNKRK